MRRVIQIAIVALSLVSVVATGARAQTVAPPPTPSANGANADNSILLTVFLKHDQSRPLDELNKQLAKQGFYKAFPPPGVEVVSWNVVMGIGQVVTLRFPASRLREVNRVLEDTAWGSYRTEFYPTYDYKAVGMGEHDKAQVTRSAKADCCKSRDGRIGDDPVVFVAVGAPPLRRCLAPPNLIALIWRPCSGGMNCRPGARRSHDL